MTALNEPDREAFQALPGAHFALLLALADGPRHGHAIKVDLALRTGGQTVIGPGTLYPALKRLGARGLIEEIPPPDPRDHDERRRYYRLTDRGRDRARTEARRMIRLLALARRKNLLDDGYFRPLA